MPGGGWGVEEWVAQEEEEEVAAAVVVVVVVVELNLLVERKGVWHSDGDRDAGSKDVACALSDGENLMHELSMAPRKLKQRSPPLLKTYVPVHRTSRSFLPRPC